MAPGLVIAVLIFATSATSLGSIARAQYGDASANESVAGAPETEYPHLEFGVDVGVLLWNGVDRNVVRPGGTVAARFGWNYKWWVPMFALGFRGNGVDLSSIQGAPRGT